MINRHGVAVAAIAVLGLAAGEAEAQQAPFTAEKNQAGDLLLSYQLERQFNQFVSACPAMSTPLTVSRQRPGPFMGSASRQERTVSSIDRQVITGLSLASATPPVIAAAAQLSLPRLFGYGYNGEALPTAGWNAGDFLQLAYEDQSLALAPGFPQLRMNATCSTVLMGALSANADFSVPAASLSAAVEADYSQNVRSSLRVADGRFISPIWEMWEGTNLDDPYRSQRQFYAGIVLWNWHRTRPEGSYNLLRSFDGTVVYRQQNRDISGDGSASTTARVGIATATVGTEASAKASGTTAIEISDVNVYVDKVSSLDFEPMPSIDAIVAAVASNTRSVVTYPDPEGQSVANGQRRNVDVEIEGMPLGLCQANLWGVRDSETAAAASSTLAVTSRNASVLGEGPERKCQLHLTYTAPQTGTGETNLTPVLFSTETRAGAPLKLPVRGMRFQATTGPRLVAASPTVPPARAAIPGAVPPSWNLGWTIDLRLYDAAAYPGINQIDVSELTVDCPSGTAMEGVVGFNASFVGATTGPVRVIRLTGTGLYAGALNEAQPTYVMCKLVGDVQYRDAAGQLRLRRAVPDNISVLYPAPTPSLPPRAGPDTSIPLQSRF